MLKKIVLVAVICASGMIAQAKVELPKIFSNNMVLKQKAKAKIWGTSSSQTKVQIQTSWDKKTYTVESDQQGKWSVAVNTPAAGGPYDITFDDGTKTSLSNILIGEVWLCSGQSNMEMRMKGNKNQPILNGPEIIANSSNNNIRMFTVVKNASKVPLNNCEGEWLAASPETTPEFSAVAFQFAQMLQKKLNVPVGIISTSWGGTPIRSWMDSSFDEFSSMYPVTEKTEGRLTGKQLYNGMIAPLVPYALSGFLWYQGENDRVTPERYEKMMALMIKEWRVKFGQGDLGFYYVQIAPWKYKETPDNYYSAFLREAQYKVAKKVKNAGLAVTSDVGSDQSIHPPNKTAVAERLYKQALVKTYKIKEGIYEGPEYKSMKVQGQKVTLNFTNTGQGLVLNSDDQSNFEVAGADKVFHKAVAKLVGNSIEVESTSVASPVAVRYAFKDYFVGNLFNKDGYPASSFRTDNWTVPVQK